LDECNINIKAYTVFAALREQRFHVFRHGCWLVTRDWKLLPSPRVAYVFTVAESSECEGNAPTSSSSSSAEVKRQKVIETSLFISFDVYKPQSYFSKNRMGKPDFCVIVLPADGLIPSVSSMRVVIQKEDSVPVRLGIVGDSSITFVEVSDFDPALETAEAESASDGEDV